MGRLYPPQLKSKLPAFEWKENISIKIPFEMNQAVAINDFKGFQILIKTVSTNTEILNTNTSSYENNMIELSLDKNLFAVGQYYKVQIAYIDKEDKIGYFSDAGIIKCTASINLYVENLAQETNNHKPTYTGVYENSDANEKVYSYYFNIFDKDNNLYETSGELIHNISLDTETNVSNDSWSPERNLRPGENYTIQYGIKTLNELEVFTQKYTISNSFLVSPPKEFKGELSAILNSAEGYIELRLLGIGLNGNFILNRSSSRDHFNTWNKITEFTIAREDSGLVIWQDFTIEQGVEYLYSIQMFNSHNIYSIHIVNKEYKIMADFEDMFLFDGERQLKIRFNPKVSTFKKTHLETKTDTIGGPYPHFFRNGRVAYKEFPIAGLISILSDENELFMAAPRKDSLVRSHTPSRGESYIKPGRSQLAPENIVDERDFKLEVLNWLTNGEPKLFRSPGEGNYIVRLMNVSMSPNDTLNRMIHSFTSNAYEIADYNFANLKKYKYLKINEYCDFRKGHITTKITNEFPLGKIQINANSITPLNGLLMKNVVITDAIPLISNVTFTYSDNSTATLKADVTGKIVAPKDVKNIKFEDWKQLKLITLDFDYEDSFSDTSADEFNKITSVKIINEVSKTKLNKEVNWNNRNLEDNTFDYLTYLNNVAGEVGEVYYICLSKNTDIINDEAAMKILSGKVYISNYDNNIEPIKINVDTTVYQNLGTLKEFICGNIFNVDIVYLQKEIQKGA